MKSKKTRLTKSIKSTSLILLVDAIDLTEQELASISGGHIATSPLVDRGDGDDTYIRVD